MDSEIVTSILHKVFAYYVTIWQVPVFFSLGLIVPRTCMLYNDELHNLTSFKRKIYYNSDGDFAE